MPHNMGANSSLYVFKTQGEPAVFPSKKHIHYSKIAFVPITLDAWLVTYSY